MGRYHLDSRGAGKNKKAERFGLFKTIKASGSINILNFYFADKIINSIKNLRVMDFMGPSSSVEGWGEANIPIFIRAIKKTKKYLRS